MPNVHLNKVKIVMGLTFHQLELDLQMSVVTIVVMWQRVKRSLGANMMPQGSRIQLAT